MRILSLVAILLWIPLNTYAAIAIPFTVTERAGVARTQGHISYGVPIAKSANILSTGTLEVQGFQAAFTVLSRYGGVPTDETKPIRMVLVDFQDSIGASSTKNYVLATTGSGPVALADLAVDKGGYVEVDTGAAVFRISKSTGNLFDHVSVGGVTLVDSPASSGMTVTVNGNEYSSYNNIPQVEIYRNGPMAAVVVVRGSLEDNSHNFLVPPTPALDKVKPDSHVEYAFYYWFYKGKSFVKVDQTLKNNGRGWSRLASQSVEHLYVDSWKSELEYTAAEENKTAEYKGYSDGYTAEHYALTQGENNDHGFEVNGYDFAYRLSKGGAQIASGGKYSGYVGLRDAKGGIMLAEKWFWQNYPGAYEVENNLLRYSFLPARSPDSKGFSPPAGYSMDGVTERYLGAEQQYRILGGMWKTHRTIYYFHTGATAYNEVVAEVQAPLVIRCTPAYIGDTKFFSFQFNPDFTTDYKFPAGEKLQDSITRWRDYARSIWDPAYDTSFGKSFSSLREARKVPLWQWKKDSDGSTAKTYPSWYGWLRFGGSPRSYNFGFNSQHYEFAYQAYLVWQRDAYYPAYQAYEELVEHLVDVLTLHDPGAATAANPYDDILLNGSQRYEQDALADNFKDRAEPINDPFVGNAHVWTRGVFVYYLLTGDPRYAEVMDQYLFHVDAAKGAGAAKGETRDLTRLMGPAINYWEVYGDTAALDLAWYIWQRLEASGVAVGSDKFVLDCRIASNKLWIGYDAMGSPYLLRLYNALVEAGMGTRASSLLDKLVKMANWNKDMVMGAWPNSPGSYSADGAIYYKYTTANALFLNDAANGDLSRDLPYRWDSTGFNANYSLAWCDLYAFMYTVTGKDVWLSMARTAFKDRFMYNFVDPAGQAVAVDSPFWQPLGIPAVPGSGSWKFGMSITQPQLYLQLEYQLSQPFPAPDIQTITAVPVQP